MDEVTYHGGDILKFAGDAIFAEWRVADSSHDEKSSLQKSNRSKSIGRDTFRTSVLRPSRSTKTPTTDATSRERSSATKSAGRAPREPQSGVSSGVTLEDCVHAAAMCGAMVVSKCADCPIFQKTVSGGQGPLVATLNVHCGLGVGKMAGVHVGNEHSRREYLILGDPIDQVSEACDSAELGELRASSEALQHLNRGQPFKNQLQLEKNAKSKVIASRRSVFFSKRKKTGWGLGGRMRKTLKPNQKFSIPFDRMDMTSLKYFHEILSFYVHPVVVGDEAAQVNNPSARDGQVAQERHRAEAELRSVFTIFIKPLIEAKLTDDHDENKKTFNRLNDIMNIVTSILDNFKGHLRQYIVDDKGEALLATVLFV